MIDAQGRRDRFTLVVNPQTRQALEELQQRMNAASISEVVRRSAAIAAWVVEQREQGRRVCSTAGEGDSQEVEFLVV